MENSLFIPNPPTAETENLRFKAGTANHDRHFHILTDADAPFDTVMFHIESFKTTIDSAVTEAQRGAAYFSVFPRTLVHPNYEHCYRDLVAAAANMTTAASFDDVILKMIKEFFTPADRELFVQQLRNSKLPRDMRVAAFARSLQRNNNRVLSLPGAEPNLDGQQIKNAFYNAMPVAWKANWNNHHPGGLLNTALPSIVEYFAHQQHQSMEKAKANAEKMRADAKNNPLAGKRKDRTNKHFKGADRSNRDNRNNNNGDQPSGKTQKYYYGHHQNPDSPCLIHKDKGHDWKDCRGNPANMKAPPSKDTAKDNFVKKPFKKQKTSSAKVAATANEAANVADGATIADDMKAETWGSAFLAINDIINEREIDIAAILDDVMFNEQGMYTATLLDISSNAFDFLTSCDVLSYSFSNQTTMETTTESTTETTTQNNFAALCDAMYLSGSDDISLYPNDSINYLSNTVRPITTMYCKQIQNLPNTQLLRVLFDSGSDKTFVNRRCLPKGTQCTTVPGRKVQGIHGTEVHRHEVILSDIMLPEFSTSLKVKGSIKATVFNNDSSIYDIILGNDVLVPLGIDILCATLSVRWLDEMIPFRPADYFANQPSASFVSEQADDPFDDLLTFREQRAHEAGYKSKDILESKYEAVDPIQVAQQQKHLTSSQRQDLLNLLSKYKKLFSGKLGKYPRKKVHLELQPNAVPKSRRPYGVSRFHLKTFKAEIDRLVQIGVLSPCGANEWLAPSFIIPKKDGRVRWISDFRELNKVIKRKVYPIPRICRHLVATLWI